MNHCASYEPLLDAFTEGDLFLEDMVRVQQHLNDCPDCQAYVEDLLTIRAAFPTVEKTEVPVDFAANVMAAVAANPPAAGSDASAKATAKTGRKKTPWVKVLSALAACCAIVILVRSGVGLNFAGGGSSGATEEAAPAEAPETMVCTTADSVTEAAVEEEAPMEGAAAPQAVERIAAEPEMEAVPETYYIISNDGSSHEQQLDGVTDYADAPYRIVIHVDAGYIGSLLEGYTPVAESAGEDNGSGTPSHTLEYELTMAEYDALLAQLADRGEMPAEEVFETDSDTVLVIVRH